VQQSNGTPSRFQYVDDLFKNMDVWDEPTSLQEVTTRRNIEAEIIEAVSNGQVPVDFGSHVDESEVDLSNFVSPEKIAVHRREDNRRGRMYEVTVVISDLNLNPRQRLALYFDGVISERNGVEVNKPAVIRPYHN